MKRLVLLFTLIFIMVSLSAVEKSNTWFEDFDTALAESKKLNRPILINFTGSDWCMWCHKLEDEVFEQPDFVEYASKNLILFMADFPKNKELSEEITKQNRGLLQKYDIKGFPTILLIDSEEKVLGTTGYREIGVKQYINHLNELLK